MRPFPWRSLEIRGLRVGGGALSVRIDDDHLEVLEHPGELSIWWTADGPGRTACAEPEGIGGVLG